MSQYIVLTPVNLKKECKSKKDYLYEREFFQLDNKSLPLWTDSYRNTAKVNDFFGFVINQNLIIILKINNLLGKKS